MSLKDMVGSSSDETGQNPILGKLKGAASGSSDIKATEIAPPKIKGKFEKAKRETKSPSLERAATKLCDDEAINATSPTPGNTQSFTQAMEIQLENDKQKHDDFIDKGKVESEVTINTEERDYDERRHFYEKEKEKRRDVEDMLRRHAEKRAGGGKGKGKGF
jgi:hypothetical protein